MTEGKSMDWKTGKLGDGVNSKSIISVIAFIVGFLFMYKAQTLTSYMHEYGHIIAAVITGGSGHILNSRHAMIETQVWSAPFVGAMGVGTVFLIYYLLSSPKLWRSLNPPRMFFTACMIYALLFSYKHGRGDFTEYPLSGVLFTFLWGYLIYKRIRGAKGDKN